MCYEHEILSKQLEQNRIIIDLHTTPFDLATSDGAYVIKARQQNNIRITFIYHGANLAYRLEPTDVHHIIQELKLGSPSRQCLFCLGIFDARPNEEPIPSNIRTLRGNTIDARRIDHKIEL